MFKTIKKIDLQSLKDKNLFVAEYDGAYIHTVGDFMKKTIEVFQFPEGVFQNLNSFDSFNDWMRDLSWLDESYAGFCIVIINERQLLDNQLESKKTLYECLLEIIQPFWKLDVENFVVGGKTKKFEIYLLD